MLTGGVSAEPAQWRSFDIEFQPVSEAELRNADGTLLVPKERAPHPRTNYTVH